MVPWTWGWELWLHLLMLHEGLSVSCGGDRTLPALSTAPAHFPPWWINIFISLCFSSVVTAAQLLACRAVTT